MRVMQAAGVANAPSMEARHVGCVVVVPQA
jgi:hypothetical protein